MENRKWARSRGHRLESDAPSAISCFARLSLLAVILLGGCASPADPYERKALVPEAVTDLAAAQSGNDVILTFTLPKETVDRRPLGLPPAIEIYRDFEGRSATPVLRPTAPANPTLLVTIPAAMEDGYTQQGRIHYVDSLRGSDFTDHPDGMAVYMVRTRVSPKKLSPDSSVASVVLRPVADPIDDLKTEVTQSAVVLTWTAPPKSLGGPPPAIAGYRIYRAEAEPVAAGNRAADAGGLKLKSPFLNIAEVGTTSYRDEQFDFDTIYVYSVRSVTQYPDGALESGDSKLAVVTPRDIFPPAAPQDLVVVLVPAQGDAAARLELSWAISPEIDIAGYNVYRSDQSGTSGQRENTELLLTPTFRDMNVLPGRRYFYSVTAVDRSGNESPSSTIASGGVPAEGQSAP